MKVTGCHARSISAVGLYSHRFHDGNLEFGRVSASGDARRRAKTHDGVREGGYSEHAAQTLAVGHSKRSV